MSDIVLLRKLTEKSQLGFGMYADASISNLLDLYKFGYLRWVYFNSSNITFMDNILEIIKIPLDYRIVKPGVDREKGIALEQEFKDNRSFKTIAHCKKVSAAINKEKKSKILYAIGKSNSKGNLIRKNHGH